MPNRPSALLLLLTLSISACAGSASKALDERMARVPIPASRQEVAQKADQLVSARVDLSEDQKKRLAILRSQITARTDEINRQSLKLRSVLIEDLLSPNYSIEEINLIKRRLQKLENDRLSLLFDGVDHATAILGRQAPEHREVMQELLRQRAGRGE